MRILAVSGSLQAGSSNAALLAAAADHAETADDVHVVTSLSTAELPAFNPDLEADGRLAPASVTAWREQFDSADGVLIATPEYAHSLPGALKNGLDWLVGSGQLYDKPVTVMAGSPRPDGAQQGRDALERTLRAQGSVIVESVTVPVSSTAFRQGGLEPSARQAVADVLDRLIAVVIGGARA